MHNNRKVLNSEINVLENNIEKFLGYCKNTRFDPKLSININFLFTQYKIQNKNLAVCINDPEIKVMNIQEYCAYRKDLAAFKYLCYRPEIEFQSLFNSAVKFRYLQGLNYLAEELSTSIPSFVEKCNISNYDLDKEIIICLLRSDHPDLFKLACQSEKPFAKKAVNEYVNEKLEYLDKSIENFILESTKAITHPVASNTKNTINSLNSIQYTVPAKEKMLWIAIYSHLISNKNPKYSKNFQLLESISNLKSDISKLKCIQINKSIEQMKSKCLKAQTRFNKYTKCSPCLFSNKLTTQKPAHTQKNSASNKVPVNKNSYNALRS